MATLTESLRSALGMVRSADPATIAAIDAEAEAARKAAEAEAKRRMTAEERVQRELPDRIAAIVADWHELEAAAIEAAAREIAEQQLRYKHGLIPPAAIAGTGIIPRIGPARLARHMGRLVDSLPVPFLPGKRAAAAVRAEAARQAHAAIATAPEPYVPGTDEYARKASPEAIAARQEAEHVAAERRVARARELGIIPKGKK